MRASLRAKPARHAEDIDSDVERVRLERQRSAHHEPAVRAADDADLPSIHPVECFEVLTPKHAVLQITLAVVAVVGVEERPAIPGRPAVVDGEDRVTLIYREILIDVA